jgi:signal transduction histidine kinase
MAASDSPDPERWLSNLPPTRVHVRWVLTLAILQVAALAICWPFREIQLARIDGFIPVFEGIIFVSDLITAVLLFSQFAIHRMRALLILACGYLSSALIIVPHALAFPGAFVPTGLFGDAFHSTAWLYWFWHLLFPLALLGYGLTKDEKYELSSDQPSSFTVIGLSVAVIVGIVCTTTFFVVTTSYSHPPELFIVSMLACVSALAVLWLRRRSLLDHWLMVVALAAILEMMLVVLSPNRFSVGFYAGRLFSLLTSTIVLMVLLEETTRLYASLRNLNETLEERVLAEIRERLEERKRAEEALNATRSELARATRVMTLGTLAATIAHEINQPLTGIITNAGTCLRMLDSNLPNIDIAREATRRTIRDGNRASEIIARLRSLFSKEEAEKKSMDLNEAAKEVIALMMTTLQRYEVVLILEFADSLPSITADRVQLQQVILNFLQNAIDAMTTVDEMPRRLIIRTACVDDDQIRLSVQDSGVGIDPQAMKRMFDPFYTTKSEGMGIGLSVSRSIIENHHGKLVATPNNGPGATFSFTIPRGHVADTIAPQVGVVQSQGPEKMLPKGNHK